MFQTLPTSTEPSPSPLTLRQDGPPNWFALESSLCDVFGRGYPQKLRGNYSGVPSQGHSGPTSSTRHSHVQRGAKGSPSCQCRDSKGASGFVPSSCDLCVLHMVLS